MAVNVDEARTHVEALHIDRSASLFGRDRADCGDTVSRDADVSQVSWKTRAIEHEAAADHQIETGRRENRCGPERGSGRGRAAELEEFASAVADCHVHS